MSTPPPKTPAKSKTSLQLSSAPKKSSEKSKPKSKAVPEQSSASTESDSTVMQIPPLRPYDPYKRGPFNILRHKDCPATIPTRAAQSLADDPQLMAEHAATEKDTDTAGLKLMANPWYGFELLKEEYGGQISLDDMKDMVEMIWKQERSEYKPGEDGGNHSSDTEDQQPAAVKKKSVSKK